MEPKFLPDNSATILVIGDVILDRYVYGETTRISPEAPVPVVLVRNTEERPGGAGNVALNIARLGISASLVGITGEDPAAITLEQELVNAGVSCTFSRQKDFPTITKLRIISQHQQLLRLDYEDLSEHVDSARLFELFKSNLEQANIVVLSDYAKGSLANVKEFISECNKHGKKVLVDPKGNDFSRYKGASLLTPNLKEFETVVGHCRDLDILVKKGKEFCTSLSLDALLVTRGEHGMTLIPVAEDAIHLTAEALEVYDVTGAGDTVIATMAAALASGHDYVQATQLANRAAGLVVAKLGAASVTVDELNDNHSAVVKIKSGILSESDIPDLISGIKARNETIVLTNGCFDIIHVGHVNYLKQAGQLGDHLIVAVNDDASVQRLKGKGRPINSLDHRMTVLCALESVDWVIPFTEDTPERLISLIKPDVLVKGGDYKESEIAGAKNVREYGGYVKIIPLIRDCSTSHIINRAKTRD
jgi:D-beta-D-heptose 7-phosphate kinase / D-beta-D-heptose 1-phosphate adenosyltransferase